MVDPSGRQPTLDEVALRAGVSKTAASRVINNAPHVSQAKRDAVHRAIRELGFVPNRTARALKTQRSGTVVLAVSLTDPDIFADPFFGQIIVGILAGQEETDLNLVLCLAASTHGEKRLKALLRHGVDGILPMSVRGGNDPLDRIVQASGVPAVYGGRPLQREPRWFVDADNYGGARAAMEHLIRSGRSRIATITGPPNTNVTQARLRGYHDALAIAGLASHGCHSAEFTEPAGAAATSALLASHPGLDAVFVHSDLMAAGVLRTLHDAGRGVPDDIAVVGFDDIRTAAQTRPALTTIQQPIKAMGREMARMLNSVLQGEDPSPVVLPTRLVVRESA